MLKQHLCQKHKWPTEEARPLNVQGIGDESRRKRDSDIGPLATTPVQKKVKSKVGAGSASGVYSDSTRQAASSHESASNPIQRVSAAAANVVIETALGGEALSSSLVGSSVNTELSAIATNAAITSTQVVDGEIDVDDDEESDKDMPCDQPPDVPFASSDEDVSYGLTDPRILEKRKCIECGVLQASSVLLMEAQGFIQDVSFPFRKMKKGMRTKH